MMKKSGNFIEEHIEKIILAIVAMACVYPFYKYVIFSPNKFPYEGKQVSAGQLDTIINEEAMKLKTHMGGEAVTKSAYEPNVGRYIAKVNSAVSVDTNVFWPMPSAVEAKIDKKYRIPTVGAVKDVSADHIRAAAYVPITEITLENVNKQESYEPNDIDLVTVQASYDLGPLLDSFTECFAGKDVPEDRRDEKLAKPVFAAVELQRQKMSADGTWGQWEEVERQKIDPRREDFRAIEDVNNLPSGSVMVRILRLNDPKIQASLLQPEPYQIASSEEEWFPPALHDKFLTSQREKEAAGRREAIEEKAGEQKTQDQQRKQRTTTTTTTTPAGGRGPGGGGGGGGSEAEYMRMITGGGGGGGGRAPGRGTESTTGRDRRPEVTTPAADLTKKVVKPDAEAAIYDEMKKITLSDKDISKLKELVFWAHDDTVLPGSTYRYRVRLGVFNPVAGTGQEVAEDATYDGKVILWSKYSDVTDPIAIAQRIYFFPVGVQEAAKGVDVQVCKYVLGYWHSEQFMVKRGDAIGEVKKVETSEKDKDKVKVKGRDQQPDTAKEDDKNLTLPEKIDYTTGAMLVDIVAAQDWAGDKNLQSRQYFDMLYSYDGTNIERMATKLMNWPEELRKKYTEIQSLEKKTKLALRAWNSTSGAFGGRRIYNPRMPTGTGERGGQMSPEEMYMMMMRGGGQMPGQGR